MRPLNILILEDNPTDAEMVSRLLIRINPQYQLKLTTDKASYLQALDEFHPDIILSDNCLPQFSAAEALQIIQERALLIPFILVTGTVSDEFAAKIIKLGADDYILKDRLTRLPVAIDTALKQRQLEKEKQEATTKLIQSEENYRTIFLKSPIPKWIYDFETLRFLEVNEAAIIHYGYTLDEFLNMTIKDIRPPEDLERLMDDLDKVNDLPYTRKGNWRHMKKNGEIIIVQTTAHFIEYNHRKTRLVVAQDVTEQVETERQREFDRNNVAALINNTKDLMWSVDKELKLITFNDAFNKTIEEMIGKQMAKGDYVLDAGFSEEQISRYKTLYSRSFSGEAFTVIEQMDEPIQFWSEISFYPIRQGDAIIGTACFSRDITERRKNEEDLKIMEQELLNQKIQEQKKVTRAIIKAQEKERGHIGRELHDSVNQTLVGIKLYLSIAGKKNQELNELIKYPTELIDTAVEEIRILTSKYVAPLKDIDLRELIQSLLDRLSASTIINTVFTYNIANYVIDDELKLNIYRIIQEQINNIIKHAEAKNISIEIGADSNTFNIVVFDDGKGFDTKQKRKGIGISNMANRVESFNGDMKIESSPGKGCKIIIKVPY